MSGWRNEVKLNSNSVWLSGYHWEVLIRKCCCIVKYTVIQCWNPHFKLCNRTRLYFAILNMWKFLGNHFFFLFGFIFRVGILAVSNSSLQVLIKQVWLCISTDPPPLLDLNSFVSPLHTYYLVCLNKHSQITHSFLTITCGSLESSLQVFTI